MEKDRERVGVWVRKRENRSAQNERIKFIPFRSDTTANEEEEEEANKFYDD